MDAVAVAFTTVNRLDGPICRTLAVRLRRQPAIGTHIAKGTLQEEHMQKTEKLSKYITKLKLKIQFS